MQSSLIPLIVSAPWQRLVIKKQTKKKTKTNKKRYQFVLTNRVMFANDVFCASTLKGLIDHLQILLHLFPSQGGDNEFRDIGTQDFVRLYLTLSYLILAE